MSALPPRARALGWPACYLLLTLAACWWRDPGTLPLTLDNRHYYFVAERAASGVAPHRSHFDSKHQLGMLVSATGIRAARAVGASDLDGARAASMLFAAAAAALAFAAGRALSGRALGGHVAALVVLGDEGFLSMAAMGARPKVFLVPFALATPLLLAHRARAAAGAAAGLAFLCWQPAGLVAAAALPVLAAEARGARGRALARFCLGAAIPVLLYHAAFAAVGLLGEMLDQTLRFPALFMAGAESALGHRVLGFFRLHAGVSLRSVVPVLFAVALAAAAVRALRAPGALPARVRAHPGTAHALLAGAAALAFSLSDYQTYVDSFLALPFAALVLGVGAVWLVERTGVGPRRRAVLAAVVVLAFAVRAVAQPPVRALGPDRAAQEALARDVAELADAGLRIWAVGCLHLLALAHRDNHVPYGFFFRGMDAYLADRYGGDGWRPLREGRMPDVVLLGSRLTPDLRDWLAREYRRVPAPAFAQHGIQVWLRYGASLPPALSSR